MMELTNYDIVEGKNHMIIMKNNVIVARTMTGIDSALHAIWVSNGRNPNHFYKMIEGKVYLQIEEDEDEMFLKHMEREK